MDNTKGTSTFQFEQPKPNAMSSSFSSSTYFDHDRHIIRSSSNSDRRSPSLRPSSTVDLAGLPRSFNLQTLQNGTRNAKMDLIKVKDSLLPDFLPQIPSNPPDPGHDWKLWLVGVFITVIIPIWQNRLGPIKRLQEKVEEVVDTAQRVTEMVEDAAEEVEKVVDKFGDSLPQGGKLQQAALFIENLAGETVKRTDLIEEVLDKIEEVENTIEEYLDDKIQERKNEKDDQKSKSTTIESDTV